MSYPYNFTNLLQTPCSYMYTPFGGYPFLDDYRKSRTKFLDEAINCRAISDNPENSALVLQFAWEQTERIVKGSKAAFYIIRLAQLKTENPHLFSLNTERSLETAPQSEGKSLTSFSPDTVIATHNLLNSLLLEMIKDQPDEPLIKIWVDRLVQRFEVSKKIYEKYLPGFRKGSGEKDLLNLYGLSALLFALEYNNTKNLKYLNVLLKVNDLLSSVPSLIKQNAEMCFLSEISIICESQFIALLIEERGLKNDII